MYRVASSYPQDGTPVRRSCQPPLTSHPPPRKMANPYLQSRGISHFRDMPNPYALPGDVPYHPPPFCPPPLSFAAAAKKMPPRSAPVWRLEPRDKPEQGFMSALQALEGSMPGPTPRNLAQEQHFEMSSEDPELPVLDFGHLQDDADDSLSSLGNLYFDFGPLAGNGFKATEEEVYVMGLSSAHEKKVLKAHEQFIRMLRAHKATSAFANYDSTYDYQFYRIFQGSKDPAKRNAMNNIFTLWSDLFYYRADGKPYQPNGFMVVLNSLFGEFNRRGVRYSLAKDFKHRGGFMRNLELRWNKHKLSDDSFAARPTKKKMPEDYGIKIRAAVAKGLLDPANDVVDCQLLFACACGTMLGFRGNQVCF
jgi:hypothetical protein